ncbi:MAG: hypothetical protein IKF98_07680, partial [Clostridia bacterium]|nr:hypothetical protein [Clostridia bacterium]
ISGKSEEDVLKGDLSTFKRAQARDKSEFARPDTNDSCIIPWIGSCVNGAKDAIHGSRMNA